MAPIERMEILKTINTASKSPKKAAVMMLFYPKNGVTHLVLIVKNSYTGVHSSQIAFPGGRVETFDKDLSYTALRETQEEIGVDNIEVIRAFSEIYIPLSNFLVSPFLGISQNELTFTLQEEEVAEIIELPLSVFLNDNIIIQKKLTTSYAVDIVVPAFLINNHVVWGATAMMMSELKEIIKKVI